MLVFRYVNAADRSNPLRRMVAAHDFAVSSIFYFGSHVSIRGCTYAKGSSCLVGFQSLKRDSPSRGVSNGCLTGEFGDGFVAELAVRPGEGSNPNTRNNCAAGSSEASFPNIDGRLLLRHRGRCRPRCCTQRNVALHCRLPTPFLRRNLRGEACQIREC